MTSPDNATNCHDDDVEEKLAIIKLWTRVKNLEGQVSTLNRYLAIQERDYKRSLPDHWSIEEMEASWQAYLDGK